MTGRSVREFRVGIAARATADVGEGPVWDAELGVLHWVDILAGEVHTSDPTTGTTRTRLAATLVGAAVPRREPGSTDGAEPARRFVAATREGFAEISSTGELTTRAHVLADGHRMNDAKCDPTGRFWAGSTEMDFAPGQGLLHVLDHDWTSRVVLVGLTLPNGMGWSPDGRLFYLADSEEGEICSYQVDLETAELSGRTRLATFPATDGVPDGLCVDTSGCLWVALWGGGRLVRIAPDGELLESVAMPVAQPSSCAFGGPLGNRLFVTSARLRLDVPGDAVDGSVFVVDGTGATGDPGTFFAG